MLYLNTTKINYEIKLYTIIKICLFQNVLYYMKITDYLQYFIFIIWRYRYIQFSLYSNNTRLLL